MPRAVIEDLRAKVRAIERPPVQLGPDGAGAGWMLGIPALDAALGGAHAVPGLDRSGVHEIKPQQVAGVCAAASQATAVGFALRLAVRFLQSANSELACAAPLVWCWPAAIAHETGGLHGPGLAALGLDPARLLIVETARAAETLWAMEEALRSGGAALVLGVAGALDLTASRRLALAAESHGTACLLMTQAASPAAGAVATRFRVGLLASPSHPFDPRAPGGFAVSAAIERCRMNPALSQSAPFPLEWCNETHRFREPAGLADRAPPPRAEPQRALAPTAIRAGRRP